MQGAFLAIVVPVGGTGGGGDVSPPIHNPPGIWPIPNPNPPGIWGGAPSYPDNGLPWFPGHPGNRPPWAPAYPGNGLPPIPSVPPPLFPTAPVAPGGEGSGGHPSNPISGGFILAWSPAYGWIYIPSGGGGNPDTPDNSLPKPPPSGGTVTPPIQPTPAPKS
jgi:hypothetical protein